MAFPTYTYTFTNGSTADATQVNQNFSDILNGVTDTTKDISVNNITCAGTATLNGNIVLGNGSSKTINAAGTWISGLAPNATNTYDFGAATTGGWRSLYLSSGAAAFTTRIVAQSTAANITLTAPTISGTLALANNSKVAINTSNGYGATNTKVRRWTNATTTGSDLTYSDSAANGGIVTVNTAGLYAVTSWQCGNAGFAHGIFVNGAQGATGLYSTTLQSWSIAVISATGDPTACSYTSYLNVNDFVWIQTDGQSNSNNPERSGWVMTKIG